MTSPAAARHFCVDLLTDLIGHRPDAGGIIADAEMIVSELVTNAVNAHCTSTQVWLDVSDDAVKVEVRDDAGGAPVLRRPDMNDEHGRGLMIVAALAAEWGVEAVPPGKRVWAHLLMP